MQTYPRVERVASVGARWRDARLVEALSRRDSSRLGQILPALMLSLGLALTHSAFAGLICAQPLILDARRAAARPVFLTSGLAALHLGPHPATGPAVVEIATQPIIRAVHLEAVTHAGGCQRT